MDSWDKFDETLLTNKEAFYSSLNMEKITDVDYMHAKEVFKIFNNKNIGDYHDYLLIYLKILEINVMKYMNLILFICTWISMASLFKKDRNKIRIVNRY